MFFLSLKLLLSPKYHVNSIKVVVFSKETLVHGSFAHSGAGGVGGGGRGGESRCQNIKFGV